MSDAGYDLAIGPCDPHLHSRDWKTPHEAPFVEEVEEKVLLDFSWGETYPTFFRTLRDITLNQPG